jgi:hypothetical protein
MKALGYVYLYNLPVPKQDLGGTELTTDSTVDVMAELIYISMPKSLITRME